MKKTSETAQKKPAAGAGRPPSTRAAAESSARLPSPGTGPRPAISPAPANEVSTHERLLTAKEIAPRIFIKPRTAALWARQGRLPAYRIGRKFGFKWEEVELALAAKCRVGDEKSEVRSQKSELNRQDGKASGEWRVTSGGPAGHPYLKPS